MVNEARTTIDAIVAQAIVENLQLVLIIDDYSTIHSIRRPQGDKVSRGKFMCTIIIKVLKNIQALPACPPTCYHNLQAIDIPSCINTLSGLDTMYKLAFTYSSVMPNWITETFFNAEFERHRVTTHTYCNDDSVNTMRKMDNVHLVDFFELTLKSREDFSTAFNVLMSTKLSEYLEKFLTPQPGDWPAQFYSRQIVYQSLLKFCLPSHVPESSSCQLPHDHCYSTAPSHVPETQKGTINQPRILSVIPCIGPLHISLNGRETVFNGLRFKV